MLKHIYIVNSPFQYFLLYSLLRRNSNSQSTIIFLTSKHKSHNELIDGCVSELKSLGIDSQSIYFLQLPISKNGIKVTKFELFKFILGSLRIAFTKIGVKYDRIFLGEFRNIFIAFLGNLFLSKERLVMDDGLSSFNQKFIDSETLSLGILRKKTYQKLSFFDNPYLFLSKIHCEPTYLNNNLFFFGSNSVDNNTITAKYEKIVLDFIRSKSGTRLTYRPHRYEMEKKLSVYGREYDLIFHNTSLCFEIDFISKDTFFTEYYAYNSTVLIFLAWYKKVNGLAFNIYNIVFPDVSYTCEKKKNEAFLLRSNINYYCSKHKLEIIEIDLRELNLV